MYMDLVLIFIFLFFLLFLNYISLLPLFLKRSLYYRSQKRVYNKGAYDV